MFLWKMHNEPVYFKYVVSLMQLGAVIWNKLMGWIAYIMKKTYLISNLTEPCMYIYASLRLSE